MGLSACADYFRKATRQREGALDVEARLRRMLALGELSLQLYASANGLAPASARESLRRTRAATRGGARHAGRP
jgi:hypothetical protein